MPPVSFSSCYKFISYISKSVIDFPNFVNASFIFCYVIVPSESISNALKRAASLSLVKIYLIFTVADKNSLYPILPSGVRSSYFTESSI